MKNEHRITLRMEKDDWELFKAICKEKGANASVKMRELMKEYIRDNTNIIKELLNKGE